MDSVSIEFVWFRPEDVVCHRSDLIEFGAALITEEVISRPEQMVFARRRVQAT